MKADKIPHPQVMSWIVPCFEFSCGLSLVFGVLSPLAASALFVICTAATVTDGWKRIPQFHPIDEADKVDDILYLPEVLYMIGLGLVIFAGPGTLALDALLP